MHRTLRLSLVAAVLAVGCAGPAQPALDSVSDDPGTPPGSGPGDDPDEDGDDDLPDDVGEDVPGAAGADALFVSDAIHAFELELSPEALAALRVSPKEFVEAQLTTPEGQFLVGVRLKGNTSFDTIDGKPPFKIDMNRYIPGQTVYGQPAFYLQNMIWDPSMVKEFLTYGFLQDAGVPAARAAYTTLHLNGIDYGLYLVLEKQHGAFMRDRFGDDGGSIYESGSFNWPCDLTSGGADDPCSCMEVDNVGAADDTSDLHDLCLAARVDGPLDDILADEMDMDLWRRSMAAEMMVSHYDNYGWNLNNFRIAHLPETDRWVFTPWSTDLSWGFYPWMDGAKCGTYGVTPSEYYGGSLMSRCWQQADCAAGMRDQLLDLADVYEGADMIGRFEAAVDMIEAHAVDEWRGNYNRDQFQAEVACLRDYVASRPTTIRAWAGRAP